eukprot:403347641
MQSEFQKNPKSRAFLGPGHYRPNTSPTQKSPQRFTLRPKTANDSSFINYTRGYPGPGQYEMQRGSDNKNGFCFNSKFKSPTGTVISRSGKRFDDSRARTSMEIPGPGQYKPQLELNQKGNYSFYKFKNSGAPVFSKAKRITNLDTSATRKITPGPGSYRMQTDFGFYDGNDNTNFFNQSAKFNQSLTKNSRLDHNSRRNSQR